MSDCVIDYCYKFNLIRLETYCQIKLLTINADMRECVYQLMN